MWALKREGGGGREKNKSKINFLQKFFVVEVPISDVSINNV